MRKWCEDRTLPPASLERSGGPAHQRRGHRVRWQQLVSGHRRLRRQRSRQPSRSSLPAPTPTPSTKAIRRRLIRLPSRPAPRPKRPVPRSRVTPTCPVAGMRTTRTTPTQITISRAWSNPHSTSVERTAPPVRRPGRLLASRHGDSRLEASPAGYGGTIRRLDRVPAHWDIAMVVRSQRGPVGRTGGSCRARSVARLTWARRASPGPHPGCSPLRPIPRALRRPLERWRDPGQRQSGQRSQCRPA